MNDIKVTGPLVQTWVPVTDHRGRTHLEARWTALSHDGIPAPVPAHPTTQAA